MVQPQVMATPLAAGPTPCNTAPILPCPYVPVVTAKSKDSGSLAGHAIRCGPSEEMTSQDTRGQCGLYPRMRRYPAAMSTPQLSVHDVRAAAETHRELGPEYSEAVVDSFL